MSTQVTDATWQSEVQEGLTLMDFWAPWCGPCRMLGPVLEEIEDEMDNKVKIVKLNIDENQMTASQFGIMSNPAPMSLLFSRRLSQRQRANGLVLLITRPIPTQ